MFFRLRMKSTTEASTHEWKQSFSYPAPDRVSIPCRDRCRVCEGPHNAWSRTDVDGGYRSCDKMPKLLTRRRYHHRCAWINSVEADRRMQYIYSVHRGTSFSSPS